jgi:hypothetical protein
VSPDDQYAAVSEAAREAGAQLALELRFEIREDEVPAQDRIERPIGRAVPDVVS